MKFSKSEKFLLFLNKKKAYNEITAVKIPRKFEENLPSNYFLVNITKDGRAYLNDLGKEAIISLKESFKIKDCCEAFAHSLMLGIIRPELKGISLRISEKTEFHLRIQFSTQEIFYCPYCGAKIEWVIEK